MEHKTGSDNLLEVLESLCVEHIAMLNLLKDTNQHWLTDVQKYFASNKAGVHQTFDGLRAIVQSTNPDDDSNPYLIKVLETFLAGQVWNAAFEERRAKQN